VDRRAFVAGSIALLVAPLVGEAQQAAKVWRIGILNPNPYPSPEIIARSIIQAGMRELGYVEGQNVVYERRFTGEKLELFPSFAAELVTAKVDLILAIGSPAVRAAKEATATIPIVFAEASQPVKQGFVASLTRPGANVTGVADISVELMAKRLELLKELVPRATRVALLVDPVFQPGHIALEDSKRVARTLGLRLDLFEVLPSIDLDATFARIQQARSDAVIHTPTALFFVHRAKIAELAVKNRLPLIAEVRQQAEAGAVLVYNSNQREMYRHVARYVDQILKGAKPADLPVQEPTIFELILNQKTARAIGLTIPRSLLVRADEVIE